MSGYNFHNRLVLVFDLGRVLVDFDPDIIISRLSPYTNWSAEDIHYLFSTAEFVDAFEKGKLRPEEFFPILKRVLNLRDINQETLIEIWNDMFSPIPEMLSLVRWIKEKTEVGLVLLSNISSVHYEFLYSQYQELSMFDAYVLSYKVGYRKPEKGIYRYLLDITKGANALFYTDDIERFVYSARELGIDGEVFRGYRKFLSDLRSRECFRKIVDMIDDERVSETIKKS